MSQAFTELNVSNFDAFISADKPVVVDFWAAWCGPCSLLSPIVDAVAASCPGVSFGKVNVDDVPELCIRFGIQSIPTLLFFRKGRLVDRSVGLIPEEKLREMAEGI